MSDLCYNCHQMHLPLVCEKELQKCPVCHNLGHSWNFCHLGPSSVQPDYQYFALCHNCQKWHLPAPCSETPHLCNGCGQYGHVREYCPIDPVPSAVFTRSVDATILDGLMSEKAQWILHNPAFADEIYNIKMRVVTDTLQLISTKSNVENVRMYLANAYRDPSAQSFRPSHHISQSRSVPQTEASNSSSQSANLILPRPSIALNSQNNSLSHQDYSLAHTLAPLQNRGTNLQHLSSSWRPENAQHRNSGHDSKHDGMQNLYTTSISLPVPSDSTDSSRTHDVVSKSAQVYDGIFRETIPNHNHVDVNHDQVLRGDVSSQTCFALSSPSCETHASMNIGAKTGIDGLPET